MMLKENRPYTQVITNVNGLKFAVPLRSEISHPTDVLWTDKSAKHGLDFTKAVIILDDSYISDKRAHIRDKEHKHLLGKEHRVKEKWKNVLQTIKRLKKIWKKNIMQNIVVTLLCNILRNTYITKKMNQLNNYHFHNNYVFIQTK